LRPPCGPGIAKWDFERYRDVSPIGRREILAVLLLLIVYSSFFMSPQNKRHIFFTALMGISQRTMRTIGMRMSRTRMNSPTS